jgi:hypothetical protein
MDGNLDDFGVLLGRQLGRQLLIVDVSRVRDIHVHISFLASAYVWSV